MHFFDFSIYLRVVLRLSITIITCNSSVVTVRTDILEAEGTVIDAESPGWRSERMPHTKV